MRARACSTLARAAWRSRCSLSFPEHEPLARAELVDRDPQRDHSQPRVEADRLPRELVEALHDACVHLRERVARRRLAPEAWQENAAVERRAMRRQQLPDGLTVPGVTPLDEATLALEPLRVGIARPGHPGEDSRTGEDQ